VLAEFTARRLDGRLLALERACVNLVVNVCGVRDPLGRVARRDFLEQTVDLLEREALGLGNEEVGEEHAGRAGRTPHEEDLSLKVTVPFIHHVRGDETNDEVPQPETS
jgi:hypothetical protein